MINGKWRSSLRDVKVRRGGNIGSDHHLVTACLKLKLKGRSRFDVAQLKHPNVQKSFIFEVRNRFDALVELNETKDNKNGRVNKNWETVVTAYSKNMDVQYQRCML